MLHLTLNGFHNILVAPQSSESLDSLILYNASPVLWYKLFVLSVLQDVVLIFDYFRSNLSTWRMFLRL